MPTNDNVIVFRIGTSGQSLVFTRPVIDHMCHHRQRRWFRAEAGGQLFAHISETQVVIESATGPRRSDWRTRYGYCPNRSAEQAEILENFARGMHYVGDWHTHPEKLPTPSGIDLKSIAECVKKSKHQLTGFVHVIVGQADPPLGWCVLIHDGTTAHQLRVS